MRVLIQRCKSASIKVDSKEIAKINHGLLVFVGFCKTDTKESVKQLVNKIVNIRIFADQNNLTNLSIKDVNGEILSVSQFTLYADTKKGNRPSFTNALDPIAAKKLYDLFNEELRKTGIPIQIGEFGADVEVELINDGPFTIMLESN
ncbi:MAG TPA: D-tyrosyl-tRNA(Tyr) deacylase [Tenericutes bacterium]|jgi:D-tyrosyl-tRNA(Tyr) deacylase|nr:D-tyrosyl-tRNA(Tyr) deacylase [Mycoplasmatota bacterium]